MLSRWMFVALLAGSPALAGCSSQAPTIEGAVFAGDVPMYKTASFASEMGGDSYSEDMDGLTRSHSWFFATTDPVDKVVAFYDQALPNATKGTDEQGFTTFVFVPEGGTFGDEVSITVRPGEIQIHESYTMESAKRAAAK
jgi:hypothetical protein